MGFYWTLPVPWAGFTNLSADVDEAAKQSRTIHYQRDLVRGWAKENGFDLVREGVFLELAPDRGGELILPPLEQLACFCRENDAALLYVDFSEVQQWRSHMVMQPWLEQSGLRAIPIWPDPVMIDGQLHHPARHFAEWRAMDKAWRAGKSERVAAAMARVIELQGGGGKLAAIAGVLNQEGMKSLTGKPWTADNLRKLLAKHGPASEAAAD